MVSVLGLYGGGSRRRINGKSDGGGGGGAWRTAAAPVRQLYWRVRSRLRNAGVLRPRRRAAARFGYDLRSYSHNFDDGHVSGQRF